MKRKNTVASSHRRICLDFANDLDDIKLARIKIGTDRRLLSDPRITKAVKDHILWETIKRDIIKAPRKEDLY